MMGLTPIKLKCLYAGLVSPRKCKFKFNWILDKVQLDFWTKVNNYNLEY